MADYADASEAFLKYKEKLIKVLKQSKGKKGMTLAQIKKLMGSDNFLLDALNLLQSNLEAKNVGSILIERWVYTPLAEDKSDKRRCNSCKKDLPLDKFYREWNGSRTEFCASCRMKRINREVREKKKGKVPNTQERRS
jgi:hypothetical protein